MWISTEETRLPPTRPAASAQPWGTFSALLLDSQWYLNLDLDTMYIFGVSAMSLRTHKEKKMDSL